MAAKQKTTKLTSHSKKGSAKKSTSTKKTNTRIYLKKRKSNGAVQEDKDDFVFNEKSISDRKELSPFPDDVLKRIFQFCLEQGKAGCYTPQRTLVNVLRVNSVFFTIAGSVLYHSPVIMDLGTFVSGSARMLPIDKFNFNFDPDLSQPEAAALARKSGCTKLVLLQYVKNLTILPCTAPRSVSDQDEDQENYQFSEEFLERLKKDGRYYKGQTYERARTILHKQWRCVTPKMVRVTIGNDQNVYGSLKDVIAKIQHNRDDPTEEEDKERVKELT
ncbi:hypothetical protein I302_102597 [Kwoniella bestiolae CBS 10118]|uniref:Uncharacterized protein n=1 Tax=Kwoniella bestiolae CBS 10118 TaxID=1296100 RepID=A0A1B9GFP0_9TREE|nr:hypothetical protein I302_01284 [Kwoniella bestiolae CBS 10118]OCF29771.1 hypothetical protein I302_01284 [Kwoniella bestiolae CBS 10118]